MMKLHKNGDWKILHSGDREEPKKASSLEICIVCGKITGVPKDKPVSERKTYMEGAGQLCENCCWEIYGTDDLRAVIYE